jgi:hypothetical protein
MKISKNKLILLAALVTPCGFVILGLWKAYELYKKQNPEKPKTYGEFVESLKKDAELDKN